MATHWMEAGPIRLFPVMSSEAIGTGQTLDDLFEKMQNVYARG